MITITRKYKNGETETISVNACTVTPDEDSAVLDTVELGAIVISKNDWPDAWDTLTKKAMYKSAKIAAEALEQVGE